MDDRISLNHNRAGLRCGLPENDRICADIHLFHFLFKEFLEQLSISVHLSMHHHWLEASLSDLVALLTHAASRNWSSRDSHTIFFWGRSHGPCRQVDIVLRHLGLDSL